MTSQTVNYVNSELERLSFGNDNPAFIKSAMSSLIGKYISKHHPDLFEKGAGIYGDKRGLILEMLDGLTPPQGEIDAVNNAVVEFNEKMRELGFAEYFEYTLLDANMFVGLPAGYMPIIIESLRPAIVKETEKAYAVQSRVDFKGIEWLPKSRVIAENGKIVAFAREIAREKSAALPDMFK